jgi:hypothetical protein
MLSFCFPTCSHARRPQHCPMASLVIAVRSTLLLAVVTQHMCVPCGRQQAAVVCLYGVCLRHKGKQTGRAHRSFTVNVMSMMLGTSRLLLRAHNSISLESFEAVCSVPFFFDCVHALLIYWTCTVTKLGLLRDVVHVVSNCDTRERKTGSAHRSSSEFTDAISPSTRVLRPATITRSMSCKA